MAEKANDEVKNIPIEPIAKLPTLSESLTEKKNRKEDLDKATLSQMSEAFIFPTPCLISKSYREMAKKRRGHKESSFKIPDLRSLQTSSKAEDAYKIYKPPPRVPNVLIPGPKDFIFEDEEACKIYFRSLETWFKAEDATEIYKPR